MRDYQWKVIEGPDTEGTIFDKINKELKKKTIKVNKEALEKIF